jgi:CheY-like chemotaxis protein
VVEADPSQIEQVVINLVVNARDAVRRRGGKITLETVNVVVDSTYRDRRPVVPEGPYVMLAVADDGEGIPADRQERIFEPFYTTKDPGQGTGLGLAVVYGIVKQSGGFIWLYSEPGLGTTFKIYFPRHAASEAAIPAETAEAAAADPPGSESILLVEDEPLVRRLAARILRGRGYRVVEVPDPAQALEVLGTGDKSFDLLLTDMVMPGMSGHELAQRIRRVLPRVRVVYMSGYSESLVQARGLGSRDGWYLAKPFSAVALLENVRTALASGSSAGTGETENENARRVELT